MTIQGRNMSDLYLLTGVALPNTPPYRLSGALNRDRRIWTFKDFDGRVGASDLSGEVKVQSGQRLRVDADLTSRRLDIDDLAAVLGARTRTNAAGTDTEAPVLVGGKLLPDAKLQTERLQTMDGTLSYRAGSVKANAFDVRQVNLGADLKDGILKLDPISFDFNRGALNGTARIDATKDTPTARSICVWPAIHWSPSSRRATARRPSPAGRWAGRSWRGQAPRSTISPQRRKARSALWCRMARCGRPSPNCWASTPAPGY